MKIKKLLYYLNSLLYARGWQPVALNQMMYCLLFVNKSRIKHKVRVFEKFSPLSWLLIQVIGKIVPVTCINLQYE